MWPRQRTTVLGLPMRVKPMEINRVSAALAATRMHPAEFVIGSDKSRAAARAVYDSLRRSGGHLPQADEDALILFRFVRFVLIGDALASRLREFRDSAAYTRGSKLESENRL